MNGMLTGLDPHSSYMNEQQWQDMQTETSGRFGGIGLEVTEKGGLLQVISPIDGTPAFQAGIKPGRPDHLGQRQVRRGCQPE